MRPYFVQKAFLRVRPHVQRGGALHLGLVVEDVGVDPEERQLLAPAGVHGQAQLGEARQPRDAQVELERLQGRREMVLQTAIDMRREGQEI